MHIDAHPDVVHVTGEPVEDARGVNKQIPGGGCRCRGVAQRPYHLKVDVAGEGQLA